MKWAVDRWNEMHGTNESVKVLHVYTGAFDNPASGKMAAEAMLGQGAVVIYQVAGATGLGVFEAVEEFARAQGKEVGPPFAIGVDSAQDYIAPGFIPVSMMKRIDTGVFTAISRALDGTFEGGATLLTLAEGGVSASTLEDNIEMMNAAIEAGTLTEAERDELLAGIQRAREAVPASAWEALYTLDHLIRTGEFVVPQALDAETAEFYREILQ